MSNDAAANRKYLVIENPGVAPDEAFTILGASNKAGTEAIGQFGSGTKFGVLALLRDRLAPTVFCGNLRLTFGTKQITFDGAAHEQVQVRFTGKDAAGKQVNRTEDLSVVLQYGKIDWTDVRLAAREFVSNALDSVNGDATQVKVEITDKEPRAKAGTTRVYIPLDDDGLLEDFVAKLGEWFLHFSGKVWRNTSILEKEQISKARIYRRGVFVREVKYGKDSLYNYNLNDLTLDEARIASDYSVKCAASKAVRNCLDPVKLAAIIIAPDSWESSFDLSGIYDYDLTSQGIQARQAAWEKAQDIAVGDRGVFLTSNADESLTKGKGYVPRVVSSEVFEAIEKHGLRTPKKILTADEREGRRVDETVNPHAYSAVLDVWNKLLGADATRGEVFPAVKSFNQQLIGGSLTLGYWKDGTVYINNCLVSGSEVSKELFAVCLEELAHHITKATDNSRDFQEFFIQLATTLFVR